VSGLTVNCPVCGNPGGSVVAPYRRTHPSLAGLSRASCNVCRMMFATPMPDESAWAAYNSLYFDNAHGGAATSRMATAFHSAINRLRGAHVERYLVEHRIVVSSVFEVGPGSGEFARHWLARHPETAYHAMESDATCHPKLAALGVQLVGGPGDLPDGTSVDLVVVSHVLEHVTDPVGFLTAVTSRLNRGGVLFIEVPCRDWEHKTQDEPHLLFFDKPPMERLLHRVGVKQARLSYHGQEIAALRKRRLSRRIRSALRNRLISRGLIAPFASVVPGLEVIEDPLERAVVRPFDAHLEHERPAWWLRAVGRKGPVPTGPSSPI
jgi:SAM-dependent methyltransferase